MFDGFLKDANKMYVLPYSEKVWWGEEFTFLSVWRKNVANK